MGRKGVEASGIALGNLKEKPLYPDGAATVSLLVATSGTWGVPEAQPGGMKGTVAAAEAPRREDWNARAKLLKEGIRRRGDPALGAEIWGPGCASVSASGA